MNLRFFQRTSAIDLQSVFVAEARKFLAAEKAVDELDRMPLEMLSVHGCGSRNLAFRTSAAVVAAMGAKLAWGRTQFRMKPGQTIEERFLGRRSKMFRIYDRDREADRRAAHAAIEAYAPELAIAA